MINFFMNVQIAGTANLLCSKPLNFYYSSIEVLIDFINSVIVFLPFFTSASNTYDRMSSRSESCLVVVYSTLFQSLVA